MTAKPRATRVGFTMVELLVVIAIIAVLAALLLTAIGRVREGIKRTTTTSDISQMEISIGKFKETFGVLPPSHITITANSSADTLSARPVPGGQPSAVYRFRMPVRSDEPEYGILQRMFPRWNAGCNRPVPGLQEHDLPLACRTPRSGSRTTPPCTLDLDPDAQLGPALGGQAVPPAAPYACSGAGHQPAGADADFRRHAAGW